MSKSDIANMSVEERIALMGELWASFDHDGLEYPVPVWHEEVLEERMQQEENNFIPFDKVKQNFRKALNAYRDS